MGRGSLRCCHVLANGLREEGATGPERGRALASWEVHWEVKLRLGGSHKTPSVHGHHAGTRARVWARQNHEKKAALETRQYRLKVEISYHQWRLETDCYQ